MRVLHANASHWIRLWTQPLRPAGDGHRHVVDDHSQPQGRGVSQLLLPAGFAVFCPGLPIEITGVARAMAGFWQGCLAPCVDLTHSNFSRLPTMTIAMLQSRGFRSGLNDGCESASDTEAYLLLF